MSIVFELTSRGLARQPVLHPLGPAGRDLEHGSRRTEQVAHRDTRPELRRRERNGLAHRVFRRVAPQEPTRLVRSQPLAVERHERRPVARSGEDQLEPTPKPRLEMRQDRADQDPQIGPRHGAEDANRHALARGPEVDIGGKVIDGGRVAGVRSCDVLADA